MTPGGNQPQPPISAPPEPIELKITSDPANLRDVRKKVENFAQAAGMSAETSGEIGLVLNEALANVIRHGYDGAKDRPIVVSMDRGDGEIHISIRDWAKPFDPSLVKPRQPSKLAPGGVGLLCIRELMDDVKYERLPDGMLLKMTKKTAKNEKR